MPELNDANAKDVHMLGHAARMLMQLERLTKKATPAEGDANPQAVANLAAATADYKKVFRRYQVRWDELTPDQRADITTLARQHADVADNYLNAAVAAMES